MYGMFLIYKDKIFCPWDVVIENQLSWYKVWFVYHLYSILKEIKLKRNLCPTNCVCALHSSKQASFRFALLYRFFSGCKMIVPRPWVLWFFLEELKTLPSWSSESIFQSFVAFWSSGFQPCKSSSRIQCKKSPFSLPALVTVFECVWGGCFSFSPLLLLLALTRRKCSHKNNLGDSQFPTASLLENLRPFLKTVFPINYIFMMSFAPNIIFCNFFSLDK